MKPNTTCQLQNLTDTTIMIGLTATGLAVSDVASAGDRTAESVVNEFLVNWDARDLVAMMTSYTDDAAVIMSNAQRFKGKDNIEALMQNFVNDFSKPDASWDTYSVTAEGDVVHMLWRAETP